MNYDKYKEIFNEVINKEEIKLDNYQINKYDIIFGINDKKLDYYCKGNEDEILKNKAKKVKEMLETSGNFIFLPIQLCNSKSFYRHLRNQFDLYLKEIQTFYKNNYRYKMEEYISLGIYRELKENQNYFELFENFEDFIKKMS